ADVQLAPRAAAFDGARAAGWRVRDDAVVLPNALPEPPATRAGFTGGVSEIVFFGSLEIRKGFDLFLDAVRDLPDELPVAFLGADAEMSDGVPATVAVRRALAGRPFALRTDLDRDRALAYLRGPGRLAVLPYVAANFPYAAVECAQHG